ncbi:hypothetical protein DSO57_1026006 [Entomophthora muscae]|uniref:Uncharacterized protein n=1 Tax=Entomophthora muscae TaxID=34485 RepID=A0ACC2RTA2_9FUNG|nr:hypothetical protein DSO57_1026006 [Entomophthora muscae]
MRNITQRSIAVMMADQYYQNEKRPLTTPKSVSPLNKKKSSDYIIDHSGPANPSPKGWPVENDTPATPETQGTVKLYDKTFEEGTHAPPISPKSPTPPPTVCNSRWNPEHPNLFAALEEQLDFDDPALAEDDPSNNEPIDATSAKDNVIDNLTQVNNVYNGETTDVYANTPMETSPFIKEESVANPPMEMSPLIYTDSTANIPMETSSVVPPDTTLNTLMDTFNTPAEMGLVDNNDPRLPNRAHPSTMNDEPKYAIPGIHRHP